MRAPSFLVAMTAVLAFLSGPDSGRTAPAPAGGIVKLDLDASEVARKILHVKLVISVRPGGMTLYYPKWIPGEHGPTGPVTDVAGLKLSALGREVPWKRDAADMFAFHLEVPSGAHELEASLDFLMPPSSVEGFSSAASSTSKMATLNWNQVLLYPAGIPIGELRYQASLRLPAGWKFGTALPVASTTEGRIRFEAVSLETLVDSPVLCGAHFREVPIGKDRAAPHFVELAAESAEALEIPPEIRASLDRLVAEASALFGSRHYRSYRFLYALSDSVAHFGLEHHESSDDRSPERVLQDPEERKAHLTLLPHEFVHSWNGKYRRPADIATADYQEPMRTNLLWVYEGLTQYLGQVLTARSGLWTSEDFRDKLALIIQWAGDHAGRSWRPLEDTAVSAQLLFPARRDWEAWRRSTDFYDESVLIWLDADTLIRDKTHGRKSLENFIHEFHGGPDTEPKVVPYGFDDVVQAMNRVVPYDWAAFFRDRVEKTSSRPPTAGVERSGWRLTYATTPTPLQKAYQKRYKEIDLSASVGAVVAKDGTLKDVIPGKAAERAGVGPGMRILAVNGRRWSGDSTEEILRAAVAATRTSAKPLELILENGEYVGTYRLDYHDGERYPRLERIGGREDLLSAILKGRS
ncbi:MAG TPA: M61 family peptidase [Candidatus Polarisedimenticolia bacterium]|nr:M61 family peptidase [Candidatus Polarisedimenticolia bacterium]